MRAPYAQKLYAQKPWHCIRLQLGAEDFYLAGRLGASSSTRSRRPHRWHAPSKDIAAESTRKSAPAKQESYWISCAESCRESPPPGSSRYAERVAARALLRGGDGFVVSRTPLFSLPFIRKPPLVSPNLSRLMPSSRRARRRPRTRSGRPSSERSSAPGAPLAPTVQIRILPLRSGEAVSSHPDLAPLLKKGWEVLNASPRATREGAKLLVMLTRPVAP